MKKLKKPVAFGCIFLIVITPLNLVAQREKEEEKIDRTEVCLQAERDAEADVNAILWMGAGLFFGLLGVGAGYLLEPSPPATRLMGKSSEYVAIYTDCYKRKGKEVQGKKALTGCIIGTLATIGLYGCLILGAVGGAAAR